ncbi:MAG: U32 family peptidase [Gammaproteobacteria bacterium]|nr:U32 family peptidase [Gammaproteobacteria bacterium]
MPALHGDFALNASNLLAATQLLDMDLQRLTLTHDLNAEQCAALARGLSAERRALIEVVAHQHLPIFHTEYCVFARFLSHGNSFRDCGRPCEHHRVHVRDPAGGDHLVQADIGCRNTVFNAAAQSAGPVLAQLQAAGIRHYRLELVDEPAHEVAGLVSAYHDTLRGALTPAALQQRLALVVDANGNRQGVALGSLAVRQEPARHTLKKPTAR